MNHVVMFSGGIGSWAAAKRVAAQHGAENVVLLFADTLIEDEDLYRFIDEAAADVGAPLVRVADGRTPWQVFHDKRWIGNAGLAQCSHLLKQEPCRAWLHNNRSPALTTIHVGIDWTEIHRLDAITRGWAPYAVTAPLCERPYVTKNELLGDLRRAGIQPPRLYEMGFPHNNCGGFCVRAGMTQFRHLLKVLPDRYAAHEAEEEALRAYLGKDVSILRDRTGGSARPLTLRELRERTPEQVDLFEWGGCGCFTDSESPA